MIKYRRIPLEGMVNLRELGGFAAENGKVTKFGRFLRSEVPDTITDRDIKYLLDYGVTLDIDFRGDAELERIHNRLDSVEGITYRQIPSFNEQLAAGAGVKQRRPFVNWSTLYVNIVDHSPHWIRSVLEAFSANDGCCLYNCTTGKDRTGVISCMLLGLAGVAHEDIIADYCISEVYLRSKYMRLFEKMPPIMEEIGDNNDGLNAPFFRTAPENMRTLLEHIDEVYGGVPTYLRSTGLSEETLKNLKSRLLD